MMAVALRTSACAAAAAAGGSATAAAAATAAAWRGDGLGGQRAGKGGTYGSACSLQKRPPNEVRGVLLRSLLPWGLAVVIYVRVWWCVGVEL